MTTSGTGMDAMDDTLVRRFVPTARHIAKKRCKPPLDDATMSKVLAQIDASADDISALTFRGKKFDAIGDVVLEIVRSVDPGRQVRVGVLNTAIDEIGTGRGGRGAGRGGRGAGRGAGRGGRGGRGDGHATKKRDRDEFETRVAEDLERLTEAMDEIAGGLKKVMEAVQETRAIAKTAAAHGATLDTFAMNTLVPILQATRTWMAASSTTLLQPLPPNPLMPVDQLGV